MIRRTRFKIQFGKHTRWTEWYSDTDALYYLKGSDSKDIMALEVTEEMSAKEALEYMERLKS